MKKMRLNLDELTVDSFDTSGSRPRRGTVFGEQCTCYTQCTCPGCPTCDASCNGTCDASCNGTCGASCNGTCGDSCNGTCGDTCALTCGYSCDSCDFTQCPNSCFGCPTVSGGRCDCWH